MKTGRLYFKPRKSDLWAVAALLVYVAVKTTLYLKYGI